MLAGNSLGLIVVVGALLMDSGFGEPPECVHPVVWTGRLIGWVKRAFMEAGGGWLAGWVLLIAVSGGAGLAGYYALLFAGNFSVTLGVVLSIYLLKSTLSGRSLLEASRRVAEGIDRDPERARSDLIALVGRDRSDLSEGEMRSATVESLFENVVDSFISPLFYFLIGVQFGLEVGVAAALLFKAVNTVDSMVGYRTKDLARLGYAGARVDDLLNWIPARLSVLFIAIAGLSGRAITAAARDWNKTPSPNSGWPMAAGSGALGVRLVKRGVYTLGQEYELPGPGDLSRSITLARRLMVMVGAITCVAVYFL